MYETRITDLDIRSRVSESLAVDITVDLLLSSEASAFALFVLKDPRGREVTSGNKISTDLGSVHVEFHYCDGTLELWYPVKYGEQPIYTLEVQISDEVHVGNFHCKQSNLTFSFI